MSIIHFSINSCFDDVGVFLSVFVVGTYLEFVPRIREIKHQQRFAFGNEDTRYNKELVLKLEYLELPSFDF